MKNIIYLSGSDAFPRIKVGVGAKPHPDFDLADWVLSRFKKDEASLIKSAAENACQAAELIIQGKTDEASLIGLTADKNIIMQLYRTF